MKPVPPICDADTAVALLADRLTVLVGSGETSWVGIDGFGATGKTTLAERVAARVPAARVVHIDDFAHPDIATWDLARFRREVVVPLDAGRPARYRVGGWWIRDLSDAVLRTVPVGVPVIVEGVSSTDERLGVDWAIRVWVEAPRAVRLARARARDGEAMLPKWLHEWMPQEEAYAAAQDPRSRADLIVAMASAG